MSPHGHRIKNKQTNLELHRLKYFVGIYADKCNLPSKKENPVRPQVVWYKMKVKNITLRD